MSWRIETANPFALLRELPEKWVQTCFLRPPRELPLPCLVAILEEVHRVLRDDGALWIALPGRGNQHRVQAIEETGWLPTRTSFRVRVGAYRGVVLFSKQQRFHFHLRQSPAASLRARHRVCSTGPSPRCKLSRASRVRRAWCVPARDADDALSTRLIEWCILASTSPRACGVCGTPWKRRAASSGRPGHWRPGCSHTNGRGSCLVLEPFCGVGPVGVAAVRLGRNYLGVEHNPESATRARRRLHENRPGPGR